WATLRSRRLVLRKNGLRRAVVGECQQTLLHSEEAKLDGFPDDECVAYDEAIRASGHCLASEALQSVHTATTVRVRDGKVAVTDGPFAETKEQLAGFYLIDAANLDEALQIAAGIPPARVGSIEVRPIRELAGRRL
ncbi:MAG: YciI family protein, partial [Nitrococcus sp.]|nr:YciI family protein [Nitrococcus sp.]